MNTINRNIFTNLDDDTNIKNIEKSETWIIDTSNIHTKEKISNFIRVIKDSKTANLANKYSEVIEIMIYLPIKEFIQAFNCLDEMFPGLSFHYVMEARHREDNTQYNRVLINRLRVLQDCNLLKLIIAPMRVRLIEGLLNDDVDQLKAVDFYKKEKEFFDDFTQSINVKTHIEQEKVQLFESLILDLLTIKYKKHLNSQLEKINLIDFYNKIDNFVNTELIEKINENL